MLNMDILKTFSVTSTVHDPRILTTICLFHRSGSHLVLGTILEDHVVIVIDTSGSMVHHMNQLKDQLINVIWEQLYKRQIQ